AEVGRRWGKVAAADQHATLGDGERIAALLGQAIGAEPAEQYVIRALILGVKFEAIAFEQLGLEGPALDLDLTLRAGRVAKDHQPAVLFPELTDTAADTLVRFTKAPLIALGGGDGDKGQTEDERGQPIPPLHSSLLTLCCDV